eukprot:3591110-Pleurochrysis_carterae.AAC.7
MRNDESSSERSLASVSVQNGSISLWRSAPRGRFEKAEKSRACRLSSSARADAAARASHGGAS